MDGIPKSRFDVSEFFNSPKQVSSEKPLRLNEWIDISNPDTKFNFRYNIYWPYDNKLNPLEETVDVFARFPVSEEKYYAGTFITPADLIRWFEVDKRSGEHAGGIYLPMNHDLLVKRISNEVVERTIADLIKENRFFQYFTQAKSS